MEFSAFDDADTRDRMARVSTDEETALSDGMSFVPNLLRSAVELGGIWLYVASAGVWWAFPLSALVSPPSLYFNMRRLEMARQVVKKDSADIRYADYLNDVLLSREAAKERRLFGFRGFMERLWESTFVKYQRSRIRIYVGSSFATAAGVASGN